MLQSAYFLAKIGADTAENKQHFAEICQKLAAILPCRGTAATGDGGRRAMALEAAELAAWTATEAVAVHLRMMR